jgi:hypothetical protein
MFNAPSHPKSGHTDYQDLGLARRCLTTPLPPLSSPKPYQASPSNSSKRDKEKFKLLINMVQALAQKLKKRDGQVQHLQERVEQFIEVTLQLESAEERLVDAAAENRILYQRVKILESTIDSESVGGTATATTYTQGNESVLLMASEMEMTVAKSQAESDELRSQLAAITSFLQQQQCVAAPESPVSAVSIVSPALALP